uniref:Uncharacterized protein n=1 Tax=Nelumbo nucifera TaxID=4432 RepID=A0A822YHD8_NELNU|nr:TPA_asm: hypothetical protein HUJ06_010712 [Nelumbo nucifera]DAD31862.1 TPA_asm: hypothetical protein HUJ06_010713 [Nelumbo nucifera]
MPTRNLIPELDRYECKMGIE